MEEEGLPAKVLDPGAMARLTRYAWPGNVRELRNLIRRLSVLTSEEVVSQEAIERELEDEEKSPTSPATAEESLSDAVERHLQGYFDAHGHSLPASGLYSRILAEVERPLIVLCLAATGGNQVKTAKLLGLNRNTLRKKIRELGVEVSRGIR